MCQPADDALGAREPTIQLHRARRVHPCGFRRTMLLWLSSALAPACDLRAVLESRDAPRSQLPRTKLELLCKAACDLWSPAVWPLGSGREKKKGLNSQKATAPASDAESRNHLLAVPAAGRLLGRECSRIEPRLVRVPSLWKGRLLS